MDAAHEPDERVWASGHRHSRMAGPPFGSHRLDAIEKGRLDYRKLFDMTKQKIVRERNVIL